MNSRIRKALAVLILFAVVVVVSGCLGIEAGVNMGPAKIKIRN